MAIFDHLGITVGDVAASAARFDPILRELGYTRHDSLPTIAWSNENETELILYPARDVSGGPHVHGRLGWQHLAFSVPARADVDRFHDLAVAAGWQSLRDPKPYPRFTERYYASFVEDEDGIRIEFMFNPPREA